MAPRAKQGPVRDRGSGALNELLVDLPDGIDGGWVEHLQLLVLNQRTPSNHDRVRVEVAFARMTAQDTDVD